jgi:ankyrin repeat protein
MKRLFGPVTSLFIIVTVSGSLYAQGKPAKQDNSLIQAIKANEQEKIVHLLSKGSNVNEKDKDRNTALMYAAANGRVETVEQLLDRGAYISTKNIQKPH